MWALRKKPEKLTGNQRTALAVIAADNFASTTERSPAFAARSPAPSSGRGSSGTRRRLPHPPPPGK
jgi:hypothetical protein